MDNTATRDLQGSRLCKEKTSIQQAENVITTLKNETMHPFLNKVLEQIPLGKRLKIVLTYDMLLNFSTIRTSMCCFLQL